MVNKRYIIIKIMCLKPYIYYYQVGGCLKVDMWRAGPQCKNLSPNIPSRAPGGEAEVWLIFVSCVPESRDGEGDCGMLLT